MAKKPKSARTMVRDEQGRFRETAVPSRQKLSEETTGEQQPGRGPRGMLPFTPYAAGGFGSSVLLGGGAGLPAWGGYSTNPMGFPGYNGYYYGTPAAYRWILQHPIVRLVRSICIAAIAAAPWEYERVGTKGSDSDRDMIKNCFDPLWDDMIAEFFARGRDYGWHSGEIIWEYADGIMNIERIKPLLHDVTEIRRDVYGNFLGLRNYNPSAYRETITDGNVTFEQTTIKSGLGYTLIPAPFKAWSWAYDSECDYAYGRSWLENLRETAWKDWLDTMQQLQKTGCKISDRVTIIKAPAGTFPGEPDPANGNRPKQISYRENAEKIIAGLAAGAAGAYLPSLGLNIDQKGNLDAMKVMMELVNKSVYDIEVLDCGSHAAAIGGFIQRLEHAEMLMFAGGLRSARVALEGRQRGGKADAEEHTDTGTYNAEQDYRLFARHAQRLLDAFMVVNRGDAAKGTWRIKTPSLVDRKTQVMKAVLLALVNDPIIAEELSDTVNVDRMLDMMNVDRKKPFDGGSVKKIASDRNNKQNQSGGGSANSSRTKRNPAPQGGRPK